MDDALALIAEMPHTWPMWPGRTDLHRRLLKKAPYAIVYAIDRASIFVVAVEHAADRTTRRGPNQRGHAPGGKPRVSVDSFRCDPMYPQVERAVAAILASSKVVAPVELIVRLGWLSTADLENWRFGRVPYLERVIRCNLTRLSRFLRILGFHCHELNLTASQTAYVRWGKGRRTALRFTKTGDPVLERVYARHFVWSGIGLSCRLLVVDLWVVRDRDFRWLPVAKRASPRA